MRVSAIPSARLRYGVDRLALSSPGCFRSRRGNVLAKHNSDSHYHRNAGIWRLLGRRPEPWVQFWQPWLVTPDELAALRSGLFVNEPSDFTQAPAPSPALDFHAWSRARIVRALPSA